MLVFSCLRCCCNESLCSWSVNHTASYLALGYRAASLGVGKQGWAQFLFPNWNWHLNWLSPCLPIQFNERRCRLIPLSSKTSKAECGVPMDPWVESLMCEPQNPAQRLPGNRILGSLPSFNRVSSNQVPCEQSCTQYWKSFKRKGGDKYNQRSGGFNPVSKVHSKSFLFTASAK